MPQNAAFDQGLHCLLTGIPMQNTVMWKYSQKPIKLQMESSKLIKMEKSTCQKRVNVETAESLHQHNLISDSCSFEQFSPTHRPILCRNSKVKMAQPVQT